jgi:hypothetical protein
MFQIGRFDPRAEEEEIVKKKRRKKSKVSENEEESSSKQKKRKKEKHKDKQSSLHVIAPETKGSLSRERKLTTKANEEAFDDLDLVDENDLFRDELDDEGDEDISRHDDLQEDYSEQSRRHLSTKDYIKDEMEDPTDELQRARHMSSLPLLQAAKRWKLASFLIQNLQADGYENFFPIQSLVLSDVLSTISGSSSGWQRDVCVAAPTGSG